MLTTKALYKLTGILLHFSQPSQKTEVEVARVTWSTDCVVRPEKGRIHQLVSSDLGSRINSEDAFELRQWFMYESIVSGAAFACAASRPPHLCLLVSPVRFPRAEGNQCTSESCRKVLWHYLFWGYDSLCPAQGSEGRFREGQLPSSTAFLQLCNERELLSDMFLPFSLCQSRNRAQPYLCAVHGCRRPAEISLSTGVFILSARNPVSWGGAGELLDLARRVARELLTRVIKADVFRWRR